MNLCLLRAQLDFLYLYFSCFCCSIACMASWFWSRSAVYRGIPFPSSMCEVNVIIIIIWLESDRSRWAILPATMDISNPIHNVPQVSDNHSNRAAIVGCSSSGMVYDKQMINSLATILIQARTITISTVTSNKYLKSLTKRQISVLQHTKTIKGWQQMNIFFYLKGCRTALKEAPPAAARKPCSLLPRNWRVPLNAERFLYPPSADRPKWASRD